MPLRWTIAPLEHMVVCVFEGVVTKDEIMEYFAALESAGALSFHKILDATRGQYSLSEAELGQLAAYLRSSGASGKPGAVAVVTGTPRNDKTVAHLRAMTPIDRRLRMFPNIHEARRWLEMVPRGRPFRSDRRTA